VTLHKLLPDQAVPAVWVHRGAGVEAVHSAVIAVVDAASRVTHALGDVEQVFFARSAIKPLQVLPLVEAGGLERFGFGAEELALCAASHNGADRHRAIAAGMLQKLGLDAAALLCGTAYPLELQSLGQFPLRGEDQDPLRHNCSGKHCGFLALAQLLEQPLASYLEPEGVAQQRVRRAVAEACEVEADSLLLGIDGCSAPNFALPLRALAAGIKNLALAQTGARARVCAAMLEHPILVSGERRLDYDVARAFPGRVIVKGGAEAILLVAFRDPPLGIAIKVVDGASRALGPILVETLRQLGLVADVSQVPTLQAREAPIVLNARKLAVGQLRADFQLVSR
jgi:L-asparaginase II